MGADELFTSSTWHVPWGDVVRLGLAAGAQQRDGGADCGLSGVRQKAVYVSPQRFSPHFFIPQGIGHSLE